LLPKNPTQISPTLLNEENGGKKNSLPEIFTLQGHYSAHIGCYSATFRYNLSVPSSRVKQFDLECLKVEHIWFPETSANNWQSTLRNIPEER